jgi:nicotinate-nucleotide pyrophosphorylase (carboxylating)
MSLKEIVTRAKQKAPRSMTVEVEVNTIADALTVAEAGADIIMLDNMNPEEMRQAVSLLPGYAKTEASGGVTLANVRTAAETGVNLISIGALTHSAKALNISLELEPQTLRLL